MWILFALLSPLLRTGVYYVDKYIVERHVHDHRALPLLTASVALPTSGVLFALTGFPSLAPLTALYAVAAGSVMLSGTMLYAYALSQDHASSVIFAMRLTALSTLVLAFVLLGERLTPTQLIGFFLILCSVVLYSVQNTGGKIVVNKTLYVMLGAATIWAFAIVLSKQAMNESSFSAVLGYESFGVFLGGFLIYLLSRTTRSSFHKTVQKLPKRIVGLLILSEGTFASAKVMSMFAYAAAPVALVSVLSNFSVVYGFVVGGILTLLWPAVFKEENAPRDIMKKVVLTVILIFGAYLIV